MATVTAEKLVELVQKSRLAEPEVLEKALEAIRSEHAGELPAEPVELAKALQKHKVITRWHPNVARGAQAELGMQSGSSRSGRQREARRWLRHHHHSRRRGGCPSGRGCRQTKS